MSTKSALSVVAGNTTSTSRHACPICSEHLQFDNMAALQCGHVYHQHCLETWLRVGHKCPICNTAVPSTSKVGPASYYSRGRGRGSYAATHSMAGPSGNYIRLFFNGPSSPDVSFSGGRSGKEDALDSPSVPENKKRRASSGPGAEDRDSSQNLKNEIQYLLAEISTLMEKLNDSERTVAELQNALLLYQNIPGAAESSQDY